MNHALVIGGTGMLADVSLWLVDQGYHVSVIGRSLNKMEKLLQRESEHLSPLLVDYRDSKELHQKINETIQENGPINLVVAWIHSNAPNALSIISEELSLIGIEWKLFHIVGSKAALEQIKQPTKIYKNGHYYQVQLGFVLEGNHSRWLTNEEIASGVKDAIKEEKPVYTVGVLEPHERRP
ncbi:short-chain dehydrogenase [Pullulanibacillus sp. KACC 23026]|uniref:short-chain dehydrogenase n=1 Tax=Pullulanibacillus sp. KACC 23026 TaxID=3028315 RepID=UPI0023B1EA1D|nr:short-chain dehydrogenase [Pullulanibacillus sp. KACC 23026]WEG14772.1 short-chain dehydrogenase [Pullulanibacillus sp. KACC 23026]